MPFSRSRSPESMTRSATSWFSLNEPDCQSIASTSVVLPWSTCATMATLRRSSRWARVFDTARQGSDPVYGVRRPGRPGADRLGQLPRFDSHLAERPAEHDAVPDEVEPRGLRVLLGAVYERHAVVAEHAEVRPQAAEAGAEAGCRDHRVELLARAVGEERDAGLEPFQSRHDPNAARAHRLDDADVEDREVRPLQEVGVGARRCGQAVGLEVRDGDAANRGGDRVDGRDRQMPTRDAEHLGREPEHVAAHDRRGRSHRQRDGRCAVLDEVDGDLGPEFPAPTTSTRRPRNGSPFR